jgi:D-glycero-alpha-D-manno-heptose 1-phosphate guanylyltransferase
MVCTGEGGQGTWRGAGVSDGNSKEALILAGGLGTRLRSVVSDRPKPVAEVAGRPFLERLLEQLERYGYTRAVLCVGYQADQIRSRLGDRFGAVDLAYSSENTPLGTAGALRQAADRVAGDDILAMNGDSFCDMDLSAFADAHRRFTGTATVAVLHRDDRSRAGTVDLDANGRVIAFQSRPTTASAGLINAGVYAFRREALLSIAPGRKLSLEEDVFPAWADGGSLFGWRVGADFIDIGTPETYRAAQSFFTKR